MTMSDIRQSWMIQALGLGAVNSRVLLLEPISHILLHQLLYITIFQSSFSVGKTSSLSLSCGAVLAFNDCKQSKRLNEFFVNKKIVDINVRRFLKSTPSL